MLRYINVLNPPGTNSALLALGFFVFMGVSCYWETNMAKQLRTIEEINEKIKKNMHSTNRYISQSLDYIYNNFTSPISVEDVAKSTCLSPRHLSRLFISEISMSIHEYITFLRIEKSKSMLKSENHTIAAISADLGFSSPQHFATTFKKHENISPNKFRKQM